MQRVFQINAFASEPFIGNPAIVCPLGEWISDKLMQRIAAESGRTCAFFAGSRGSYQLRWFTPKAEIEGICGHGTLAAGFVILNELDDKSRSDPRFRLPRANFAFGEEIEAAMSSICRLCLPCRIRWRRACMQC
jgi:predicted PhzF superfamily epimerase YddE/YHI9